MIELRNRTGVVFGHALVDPVDLEWADAFLWHVNGEGYVERSIRLADGRRTTSYLHREILGLERGDPRTGDHENRDRLDNRRSNLRIVTKSENNQNVSARPGTSAFRGVCWDIERGRWLAYARVDGAKRNLGRYDDEQEAAAVAAAFRAERMPFSVADTPLEAVSQSLGRRDAISSGDEAASSGARLREAA